LLNIVETLNVLLHCFLRAILSGDPHNILNSVTDPKKNIKPCCRKETARYRSCSFRFKVRRQNSLGYKFKSSQASKARLHGFKNTGAKQNLTQNGHSRSFKVTCFGVSGKELRD